LRIPLGWWSRKRRCRIQSCRERSLTRRVNDADAKMAAGMAAIFALACFNASRTPGRERRSIDPGKGLEIDMLLCFAGKTLLPGKQIL
jgi:hypothetical protein